MTQAEEQIQQKTVARDAECGKLSSDAERKQAVSAKLESIERQLYLLIRQIQALKGLI